MPVPAVNVRSTIDRLVLDLGLLPQERAGAAVRAINRTMTTVRAEAARAMQAEYPGLKISVLKKRMPFTRATRGRPSATLIFRNTRFSLFHNWRARQSKTGVRVGKLPYRLETWSGEPIAPGLLRRAFIQRPTDNRGRWNVYIRIGRDRYPIEGIVAPSLAAAFVERKIGSALVRLARSRFDVVFLQEAKFRLSKRAV